MSELTKSYQQRVKKIRQTRAPDEDHNSNWAISYGDMITLLLAFFVIFFNTSKSDPNLEKLKSLVDSEFQSEAQREPDAVWGKDPVGVLNVEVQTKIDGDKLIIEFPKTSFFRSAEFELTEEGKSILSKFARTYQDFTASNRLIVRGYTDNRPVRASMNYRYKDNLELSSLRAISALRVLNSQGIPFEIMRIGGYGETDKSVKISDEEMLRYDRKIVLVVEPLDKTERGIFPLPKTFDRKSEQQGDQG